MNKRTIKIISFSFFILICILIVLLLFFMKVEIKESFYPNMDAAKKDGAVGGSLPEILPKSSSDIYERHDIDTNIVWIKFKFDKSDGNQLLSVIKEVKTDELATIEFIMPDVKWWPRTVNIESTKYRQSGLKLYKYEETIEYYNNGKKIVPAYFIIDWNSCIGYYWHGAI